MMGSGNGTADITDPPKHTEDPPIDESGGWLTGTKNKAKPKSALSGFDFGKFSAVEENEKDTNAGDNEAWGTGGGGFMAGGNKDKKSKKKAGGEAHAKEPEPATMVTTSFDPVTTGDDALSPWGTANNKKDKKKTKKGGDLDASIGELPQNPAMLPETSANPVAEEEWGTFGNKNKKKGKKGNPAEPRKAEGSATIEVPQVEPEPLLDAGRDKKEKKKSKKGVAEETVKPEEPMANSVLDLEPEIDFEWGLAGDKKKKQSKNDAFGEIFPLEESAPFEPEPEPELDIGWGFGSKNKKKTKKAVPGPPAKDEDPTPTLALDPEFGEDAGWGSLQTKKDKSKNKKDAVEENKPAADLPVIGEPKLDLSIEDKYPWSGAAKKDKKGKKIKSSDVKEDPISVPDSAAPIEASKDITENNWADYGSDKKKDKKAKKGAITEVRNDEEPSVSPAVPEVPETTSFDLWGSKRDKKTKKGKVTEPEIPPFSATETFDEFKMDPAEEEFGSWGLSAKERKEKDKKDKEREEQEEKEKKEREEKEKAEKEEEEKKKEKPKPGRKGKISGPAASSKTKDLMANSTPDPITIPSIEENSTWGTWEGTKNKDKKKGGKNNTAFDVPPPVPTPPAQGLTPEPEAEHDAEPVPDLDDFGVGGWGSYTPAPAKAKNKKDKKSTKIEDAKGDKNVVKDKNEDFMSQFLDETPGDDLTKSFGKEETPAKAAKSFWGGMGPSSLSKSKAAKEKEKAEEEARKLEKEKAERAAEEEEAKDLIQFDMDADSMIEFTEEPKVVEPIKKNAKSKAETKLSKVSTKDSDKSGKAGLSDKKKNMKGNVSSAAEESAGAGAGAIADFSLPEADEKLDDKDENNDNGGNGADAWSFWGGTKKTSGKKGDDPKKEITKQTSTNQKFSLNSFSNEPEPSLLDDEHFFPKTTKTAKPTMTTANPFVKSSIAEKVKAFEKVKEKPLESIPSAPVEKFVPLAKTEAPLKKASAGTKSKATATATGKNTSPKKKDLSPPTVEEKRSSKDSVPGSFPAEGDHDDFFNTVISPPAAPKVNKKAPKSKKEKMMDPMDLMDFEAEASAPPPEVPEAPPTPPPEQAASKPAKKERAKVVRDGGASWGFWGTPKKPTKEVKSKDDAEAPTSTTKEKPPVNGLSRAKSTKVAKEKEVEKLSAKSSSSDKDKKPDPRPPKSRGSSFGGLFRAPPPARTRPVRRQTVSSSRNPSRGQSMDIDAVGLPSPPAEDLPEMSTKAAKLMMGTGGGKPDRNESTKGKKKAPGTHVKQSSKRFGSNADNRNPVVPDPYPIDDDDMVLVNALEDPIINAPIPKTKEHRKTTKSKSKNEVNISPLTRKSPAFPRNKKEQPQAKVFLDKANISFQSRQTAQPPELADDIVMVEAGPSRDAPETTKFRDDLAFSTEKPRPLQRSATSAKKPSSKFMGLLGGFQKTRRLSDGYERSRGKAIDEEEHLGRKRTVAGGNDATKRVRRDDRRMRRSERPDVTMAGLAIDDPRPDEGVILEPNDDDARKEDEARREARRAKRASKALSGKDVREPDDRRARRREADQAQEDAHRAKVKELKEKKARKEEEQEASRQEEKLAKRAAKDERLAKEDQASKEIGFDVTEKRSKHRDREPIDREAPLAESSSRPRRSDRRRSHIDKPLSPTGDLERRPHRSRRPTGERSSRRKSTAPVDDYFDPRNGALGDPQPTDPTTDPDPQEPYMHGANDPTSSWVKSQISEPPPPPPLEPSVLDPAPVLGEAPDDDAAEDEARRMRRRERRQSKYRNNDGEEGDGERRRRRREVRSSEGSGDGGGRERRKSDYGGVPLKGFESRGLGGSGGGGGGGAGGGKRGSWFKKIGLQI